MNKETTQLTQETTVSEPMENGLTNDSLSLSPEANLDRATVETTVLAGILQQSNRTDHSLALGIMSKAHLPSGRRREFRRGRPPGLAR